MKKILKAVGFLILIGVAYLIANIIAGVGFGIIVVIKNIDILKGTDPNILINIIMNDLGNYILPMVIVANLVTLGFIALFFLARKDKLITYCRFKKIRFFDAILIFGLGFFLNLVFVSLLSLAESVLPISESMETYGELMNSMMNSPAIIVFITIVIIAPIFEEILMRGIVLNDFRKATPLWLAIIIQGVAFGILHFNVIQSSYAAVLGIILGIIYVKYNSLWMPILMHLSFNLTSLVSETIFGEDISAIVVGIIGFVGTAIIIVLAVKL